MACKLRVVCPLCIICLAVLVFSIFGMDSKAVSDSPQGDAGDAVVTYTVDPWSAGGLAEPTAAQETTAALQNAENDASSDSDLSKVPAQEHRDSGYELTDDERKMVERIVMCESGGEGERGQMMVAQCILEGMLRYGYTIDEYIENYKVMITSYSNVTDEVKNSVSRVFDNGERVTEEKVDLWYNPAITASAWHEQQEYVMTVGSHRFFWMIDNSTET